MATSSSGPYARLAAKFEAEQTIAEWEIGRRLGYGGFSFTHESRKDDTFGCAKFAVKSSGRNASQQRQLQEYRTEIEALQTVDNPHVVRILEYIDDINYDNEGVSVPCYMMVLELCPGGDLFDIIYYTQNFDEDLARTVMRQIVEGIAACHDQDVCHRDIKAQNIVLDDEYRAKIIDFGASKLNSNNAMHTQRVGTKGYQAPELLIQGVTKYTKKCDTFSLGVLLFVMLTRKTPFTEASRKDRRFKMLARKKYDAFWEHFQEHNISAEGRDLLQRMLEYQPSERLEVADLLAHEWFQLEGTPQEQVANRLDELHQQSQRARQQDSNRNQQQYDIIAKKVQSTHRGNDATPPPLSELSRWEQKFVYQIDSEEDPMIYLKMYQQFLETNLQGTVDMTEEDFMLVGAVQFASQTEEEEEEAGAANSFPLTAAVQINIYNEGDNNYVRFSRFPTQNTNDECYGFLRSKLDHLLLGTTERDM